MIDMNEREIQYSRDETQYVGLCPACGADARDRWYACNDCLATYWPDIAGKPTVEARDWLYRTGVNRRSVMGAEIVVASDSVQRHATAERAEADTGAGSTNVVTSIPVSRLVHLLAATDPALLAIVDRVSEGDPKRLEASLAKAIERDEAGARTRAEERAKAIVAIVGHRSSVEPTFAVYARLAKARQCAMGGGLP